MADPGPSASRFRRQSRGEDWESDSEEERMLDSISETQASTGSTTPRRARRPSKVPISIPRRAPIRRKGSRVAVSTASNSLISPRRPSPPARKLPKDTGPPTPLRRAKPPPNTSTLGRSLSIAVSFLTLLIRLVHVILYPVYPYVFGLVLASAVVYYFLNILPSLVFKIPGLLLRRALPSIPSLAWWNGGSDADVAMGQGLTLLPVRTLATPLCALIGQGCALSLLTTAPHGTTGGTDRMAQPFWRWYSTLAAPEVDVGEVARSLAREAKGAKDIFESISQLSSGQLIGKLEYLRVYELGIAVDTGSTLDDKEFVSQQLFDVSKVGYTLHDELVETNAMAVNAFTWLQWEFASLVKVLSLPKSQRPDAATLSHRLNTLLNRLSATLTDLHGSASVAHSTAVRGAEQGKQLRSHLSRVNADMVREQELEPGWKVAVDKVNHFLVGGEPSKGERLRRDVAITRSTIDGLSSIVHALERSRIAIKGFRDQIGFFDASMMGFHLGASVEKGIGPEEEVRVLADIVEEFGRAVGRAKGNDVNDTKRIEG